MVNLLEWNPENEFSFSPHTIYETIVTTNDQQRPNLAPMGTWFDEKGIQLQPYMSTKTYELISKNKECVVNICWDVRLFAIGALKISIANYQPIYVKSNQLKTQRLSSCNAWFECIVKTIKPSKIPQRAEIKLDIVNFGKRNQFFCPNRADAAILEAIIHSTRISHCRTKAEENELRNLIALNLRLAKRISTAYHHTVTIKAINDKISSEEGATPANRS